MNDKEIKALEVDIVRWKYLYYNGTPEVSDEVYDAAEQKLRALSPRSYALSVGYPIKNGEKHIHKMLSIQKALTPDALKKWFTSNNNDGVDIVCSHKIDGLALELIYKSGVLVKATTRGDGSVGEDVTKNVLYIDDIPKAIPNNREFVIVRGEVYMRKSVFNKLKDELNAVDPRNLAVGSLKCDDVKTTEKRNLSFFAYKYCTDYEYVLLSTYSEELKVLNALGFKVVPAVGVCSYKEAMEYFRELETERDTLDYKIDGMVLCLNDNVRNAQLGNTDHHPRYSICLKFEAEKATTTVRAIYWSMSRYGNLTPVAVFDPVVLAGATITCAKAHNINFLTENNINIGNSITIVRSGDVIPKIVAGDTDTSKVNIVCDIIPNSCPFCKARAEVVKEVNTHTLRCTNDKCYKKTSLKLEHFLKEIGIKGVGEAILDDAAKKGISNLIQLYGNDFIQCFNSPVIAKKIKAQLNASFGMSAIDFVAGLGIPEFSRNSVTKWFQLDTNISVETMNNFPTLSVKEIVGEAAYATIKAYYTKEVREEVLDLIKHIKPLFVTAQVSRKSDKLAGLKICLTGTLSMSRPDMESILKEHGATIVSAVSSNTSILLAGEKAGSKRAKAESIGVKVLDEAQIMSMIV